MEFVKTKEEFSKLVNDAKEQFPEVIGFGICRVDRGQGNKEKILQATYPVANWNENFGSAAIFLKILKDMGIEASSGSSEFVSVLDGNFFAKAYETFYPLMNESESHKNVQVIKDIYSFLKGDRLYDVCIKETDVDNEIHQEFESVYSLKETNLFKICFIFKDEAPESVESVYLKLYALSQKKAEIRGLNLNGAFGQLENVAWSGNYPIELDWLRKNEIKLKITCSYPDIDYIDKFPRLLHHVIPEDNTRILDTAKVRMGAQLAAGTTVMPGASYINFNAGTTGPCMVEGRISSSAVVGAGTDVGGGASILGVLSGTDGDPITIGENCLLGANSVCGIPLGDGCIIDGGIAVLPGTKVLIPREDMDKIVLSTPGKGRAGPHEKIHEDLFVYKAKELAGYNGLHFRQDSQTGQYIVKRSTKEVKLNEELH